MATKPAQVRKALAAQYGTDEGGEAFVSFYRSPLGYYYFSGLKGIDVPSIYSFNLDSYTTDEILEHVEEHFQKGK